MPEAFRVGQLNQVNQAQEFGMLICADGLIIQLGVQLAISLAYLWRQALINLLQKLSFALRQARRFSARHQGIHLLGKSL